MKIFFERLLVLFMVLLFGIVGIVKQTSGAEVKGKETIPQFGSPESLKCQKNEDCELINKDLGWRCCWAGYCGEVNRSLDEWIAINIEWFEEGRAKYCPSKEECGPSPMCAVRIPDQRIEAQCVQNFCQKVSK